MDIISTGGDDMDASKSVVITYTIKIDEEERKQIIEDMKAVNDGEGSIDEYKVLANFLNLLKVMVD